jgi:hypothetical protein
MERRFRRFCIPHLTLIIIFGQVLLFLAISNEPRYIVRMVLQGKLVIEGEYWRLVTFAFLPGTTNIFLFLIGCFVFHLMGNRLEQTWGIFRYNLFLLSGYIAALSVAFIFPAYPMTNVFIGGSVFLAFATLFPDFSLMVMFILPVKIRWLALVYWIFMGIALIEGSWPDRCIVVAGVLNYFLFFGADIARRIKRGKRKMKLAASKLTATDEPFHTCHVCGITDQTDPMVDFRYCSQCRGSLCYCEEHIRDHEHVTESN